MYFSPYRVELTVMDHLLNAVQAALDHATFGRAVASAATVYTGYKVLIALYNISPLHPLHKFPGPKLAAAGYFYEAYYDWIRGGRYTREIKRMHEKYGKHTGREYSHGNKTDLCLYHHHQDPSSVSTPTSCTATTPISPTRSMRAGSGYGTSSSMV